MPIFVLVHPMDLVENEKKERRHILDHLINVVCALTQHIFEYFPPISLLRLLDLLNSIYIDLLKVKGLSQNEYFSTSWLMGDYLKQYPMFQDYIFLSWKLENAHDTAECLVKVECC